MAHVRSKHVVPKGWLLSDSGKYFSFHVMNATTASVFLGHILPHTAFVTTYRDYVRLYSNGFVVPVPDKVTERFEKTLELLQIKKPDRNRYLPFMSCGFDMFSAGTYGRFGVHIGIPVNFTYNGVEDIERSKILVNQESVVWDSDAGKQLLNALVIPENGQLYAMAQEIKIRDSWKLYIDTMYAFFGCALTYLGSQTLNKRLNLYSQPRQVRLLGYALVASLSMANYLMCKDLTQILYEERIDKELKELSPIFAEGGKQFYSKILERNKALRVLLEKEGESKFTVLGNENSLFRTKHRPIVQRKAFFEEENLPEQVNQAVL